MAEKILLDELITITKEEIGNQKYASNVMREMLFSFQQLSDYAKENGIMHYCTALVKSFMTNKYDYPAKGGQVLKYKWNTIRTKITHLKKLEWMHELSFIEKGRSKICKPLSQKWVEIFDKFSQWQIKRNFAESPKSRYDLTLNLFADYMMTLGVNDVANITHTHISDYTITKKNLTDFYQL